jgi:NRAMP (natural resistance-associated macrophage protein)-like metal ion transporter
MLRRFRYHIALFFAVIGPGFITAVVDNDAGGILTYSQAGAKWGYLPLWTLLPITVLLIVTQEMCSRMGAVTGKGLSDLIREEFGLRTTFTMMVVLILANLGNMIADFAGVAESLELFGVPAWLSVPLSAVAVWLLIVKVDYNRAEKIFLWACVVYIAYIISGILVRPNWKEAAIDSVRPVLMFEPSYITMIVGMVGTSIAPWMQFYLQAAVVEKGITAKEYAESRIEVIVGCIVMSVTAFFIVVACAGAIWSVQPRDIQSGAEAALGLKPFGRYAYLLFAAGLFNASLFAATILPISTAYTVCEALGFEAGVNQRFRDAPIFYWLFTGLIVVGAGVVLVPQLPRVKVILLSQVINGVLLPVVLIFMILLINRQGLMKEWVNSRFYNVVSWVGVAIMIGLSLALVGLTVKDMMAAG